MKKQLEDAMNILGGVVSLTLENGLVCTQDLEDGGWSHTGDVLESGEVLYEYGDSICARLNALSTGQMEPEPMLIFCPVCHTQHIDEPDPTTCVDCQKGQADCKCTHFHWWQNPPHTSHQCHGCGHRFRLADILTNGVAAIETKGSKDTWNL